MAQRRDASIRHWFHVRAGNIHAHCLLYLPSHLINMPTCSLHSTGLQPRNTRNKQAFFFLKHHLLLVLRLSFQIISTCQIPYISRWRMVFLTRMLLLMTSLPSVWVWQGCPSRSSPDAFCNFSMLEHSASRILRWSHFHDSLGFGRTREPSGQWTINQDALDHPWHH